VHASEQTGRRLLDAGCNGKPETFHCQTSHRAGGAGAAAEVPQLGLVGGSLPADPYAPVTVAWPRSSAAASTGLISSPCSGDVAVCSDAFAWRGTVRLMPVR
jgi:hypothetical protein